ncbi:hypothetical protein E4U43_006423 [Claviceps pusilla]|uniref:TPR repeat-containing protein P27G11.02 n=1 Tax=Claviceps pusilla TaxID=123648 RepID=A0A9P7T279_9HYPO|nr:hypothetical protein E4U43_006423 [Claviceps pusilla]
MSVAVASLRPLRGRCLRHATSGMLSVRVQSASTTLTLRAVISLPPSQTRCQSQSSPSTAHKDQSPKQEKPSMTFRQFVGRALGASLRNVAVAISPRGIRSAYKDAPALTSMNIILLALLAVISAVAIRSYVLTFYHSDFSRYPEPVANSLRRALYHSNYKPDPERALKYYKLAMERVVEMGMDPFSDEVLGIRIQVAAWLERINSYKASIDVLESVLQDCKKWIAAMEQSVSEGKVTEAGRYRSEVASASAGASAGAETKASSQSINAAQAVHGPPRADGERESCVEIETLWRKRQRLLAKAIGTAVKLGELYADEHVRDADKSHEHLVWALEHSLREFKRRADGGAKPGEQAWLSATELGGIMESLGRDYERRSQFGLAIPLFFQALKVCDSPCHRAVIMNNLAACFSQQQPPPQSVANTPNELSESIRAAVSDQPAALPPSPQTRTECLEAALNWAQNAHRHGQDVRGEARTPECDEACAVALCNWADVAAMLGKPDVARQKYTQCIEKSNKMGFRDGTEHAKIGLAKLAASTEALVLENTRKE